MYPDVLLAEMLLINQVTESWFLRCLVKQTNKYKNCLFTQMNMIALPKDTKTRCP